jgi:hypothetical protein
MIANSHKAGKLPGAPWGVWSNPGFPGRKSGGGAKGCAAARCDEILSWLRQEHVSGKRPEVKRICELLGFGQFEVQPCQDVPGKPPKNRVF